MSEDYEQVWDDFWKDIVTNEDGSLNLDQIKRELFDFHVVLDEVPLVYVSVTGGMLSKPNYPARTVISEFENYVEQLNEWAISDFLSDYDIEDPRKEETND